MRYLRVGLVVLVALSVWGMVRPSLLAPAQVAEQTVTPGY